MQNNKPKFNRGQAFGLLFLIIVVLGLGIWLVTGLFSQKPSTQVSASKLPCSYSETIRPFGENVLYYDGMSIHCMSSTGGVRWSFPIGSNASFDCTDDTIAAWIGSTIFILDENGTSSYNDNLNQNIQFARVGKQYVAAVVGEEDSPRLLVKDLTGAHMDEEADAYSGLLMLDVGFYGNAGQYMWTLALDVYGTAANTTFNTFEVGKMNTGEVSLGESITYDVVYENSQLRVINTRQMRTFNDRGVEDASASVLVYGWYHLYSEVPERGNAYMLFAPTSQTENMYDLRELRLISGKADKRYSLPATCVGATIWNKNVFAVSGDTLYRIGMSDTRFTGYELPLDQPVTRLMGVLTNGKAIVACSNDVYVITLPTGVDKK